MQTAYLEGEELVFSTGKRLGVVLGVIGMHPVGGVVSGYDDNVPTDDLTNAEYRELCDYMIVLWEAARAERDG